MRVFIRRVFLLCLKSRFDIIFRFYNKVWHLKMCIRDSRGNLTYHSDNCGTLIEGLKFKIRGMAVPEMCIRDRHTAR